MQNMLSRLLTYSCAPLCLAAGLSATTLVQADVLNVPSERAVTLVDVRIETDITPPQARFRYLMPDLVADFEYEQVSADLLALCSTHALPELGKTNSEIRQIVVSLSDRSVKFGEVDAEAVQVFEQFLVDETQCIWGDL